MTDILAIGNLPPPVHGQSLVTKRMIALLRERGFVVDTHDLGPGDEVRARPFRRLARHMTAILTIVRSRAHLMYIAVNNGSGMALIAILCLFARLSGKTIVLHHHSMSYVTRPSGVMRLLTRTAGRQALHVVQSDSIGTAMARAYGIELTLGYSNIGLVENADDKARWDCNSRDNIGLTLGYLANVTTEKGIYVLIDAFARLRKVREDVRLLVAGPCRDTTIMAALSAQKERFGSDFDWIGGVYGPGKRAFFEAIDIFVFPTLYPTETQGLVNLEALGAGVPVVAFDRGRIGEDISASGGMAVAVGDDFALALEQFIERFEPGVMREAARGRYERLLSDHDAERTRLLDWVEQAIYPARLRG